MKNISKTFTYTAQRSSYMSTVCALHFIIITEAGLITLLIVKVIPNELIKLALLITLVALLLYVSSKMLAPLLTNHRLSGVSLFLHYGLDIKAEIPRSTISAARQMRERVPFPVAKFEAEKERIVASFSEQGQVLLLLDRPYPFRVGLFGGSKSASQVLINVDKRDEFLSELGLQVTSSEKPALATITQLHSHQETRFERITYSDSDTLAIRTENLTRHYKDCIAVDNLKLAVDAGEIYGFLGSNGAGKTTTMKMLVGLLQPDAGHAWIDSHDVWSEPSAAKAAFGYVADHTMLYDRLTGHEFLDFLAQIRGIPEQESSRRIEQLLNVLDLKDRAYTACGTYSFGMKRKLAIAGALMHKPRVLILDEPLHGLDPISARRLKDLFVELAADGSAIFLSTHDLATAESICHRVGISHKGRLLVEGSTSEIRQVAGAPDFQEAFLSLTSEGEQVPV